MNVKFLIKAVIIGVCALALSSYFVSKNKGIKSFNETLLLTDFDANLVDDIQMQTAANKELVNAKKVLGQWQLPNKAGYAADVTKLSKLLQNIKDAHIVELKTKQQKYFHRLGLQDISDQGITNKTSNATLLTLISGSTSVQLLLGNESSSANGRYIRFADQQQTYLVDLDIDIPEGDTSWLLPTIVSVEFDQIRQVDITLPDSDFSIVRKEIQKNAEANVGEMDSGKTDVIAPLASLHTVTLADNFELTMAANDVLKGQEEKQKTLQYESIFTGLVRNIINLTAKDVQLVKQNNMELYQTIVISYLDKGQLSLDKSTQVNESSQTNTLTLRLYRNNDEQTDYWLQADNQKWLLKISEFDFKQVSKSLDSYFE